MPWKETRVLDERMRLVLLIEEGESVAEAARQFGVSRVTAHKWVSRYRMLGVEGLRDESRAPRHHPNAVEDAVIERIVALRSKHPSWGPLKLMHWLRDHEPAQAWPCASTIGVALKERGLTSPSKRRRVARYNEPLAHCDGPNRVWCAGGARRGWRRKTAVFFIEEHCGEKLSAISAGWMPCAARAGAAPRRGAMAPAAAGRVPDV